jgi:hypothetical protein
MLHLLMEESTGITGIVFDPCKSDRHVELRHEVQRRGLESVLDTLALELSMMGGLTGARAQLPWANDRPHELSDLQGRVLAVAQSIAEFVADGSYSAVLAPTHFLQSHEDPWLAVDRMLTNELRDRLDHAGRGDVLIYYPLAIRGTSLRTPETQESLIRHLAALPIDGVWLRVHPFGVSHSGPVALRGYIEACRQLHRLRVPLVAERTGTIGLALLAFGAVGGIEGGITLRENFSISSLQREPSEGWSPAPRVYLPSIGAYLKRDVAERFFENRRMRSEFGCRNSRCCRTSLDLLRDPRRHFTIQRIQEVAWLSRIPEQLRPNMYLDDFLRPATDLALQASRIEPSLETHKIRLESWRISLGAMNRESDTSTVALSPQGRRIRHLIGA